VAVEAVVINQLEAAPAVQVVAERVEHLAVTMEPQEQQTQAVVAAEVLMTGR
jgi:hypothetical protein